MNTRRNLMSVAGLAVLAIPLSKIGYDRFNGDAEEPAQTTEFSGRVLIDGSSTVAPITEAVSEEFHKIEPNVEVVVDISGTGGGFKRFCANEIDIVNASRPITPEEQAICESNGVTYAEFEIAYDGITLVTSIENDWLTCLTTEQLRNLWKSDSTITKWSQLNPLFPDTDVVLYGPGTDSGTFDYFTETIVGEKGNSRNDYSPSENDNTIVVGVQGYKDSLGYFGYAYYIENQDKLKVVSVDDGQGCITPTKESIRDSSYTPLSRPLFVYVNVDRLSKPEVAEFMRSYLDIAETIADDVGYVASPSEVIESDKQLLEALTS